MKNNSNKPTFLFWIIGVLALLWNAMGVNMYLQQTYKTEAFTSFYTEEQLQILENLPAWYTAVFALAVFGSSLASILFLLRRKFATFLYFIALIFLTIQSSYNLFFNEYKKYLESMDYILIITLLIVGTFLYFYAKKCEERKWLV